MIYSLIENLIIGIFVDQDFSPLGHLQAPFSLSLKPICLGQNVHVAFLGVGVESFQLTWLGKASFPRLRTRLKRIHKCEECPYATKNKANLSKHTKHVHSEKPMKIKKF